MKFTGEYRIEASREKVWAAINNPEILRRCIPGCEEIVRNTPTDWTAKVITRVGPVKARFAGNIRLEDLEPPTRCRIVGEGSGGAAGFASGGAIVALADEGPTTVLTYAADAEIGGKLAQIGSRLIESFARRYADDFFAGFARIVAAEEVLAAPRLPEVAQAPATAPAVGLASQNPAGAMLAVRPSTTPPAAPGAYQLGPPHAGWRFDAQSFTIVILALLLVFMTIMVVVRR